MSMMLGTSTGAVSPSDRRIGKAGQVLHALTLPPYGELADPFMLVEVAVAAERAGWDAVFLWDHVLRREGDPQETADPWVAMAAIAVATERVRIGPMVTPITRRRPIKLARETTTLDHLSRGRLTLGLGLGVDTTRELERVRRSRRPACTRAATRRGRGSAVCVLVR